jgi:hypothetical protein
MHRPKIEEHSALLLGFRVAHSSARRDGFDVELPERTIRATPQDRLRETPSTRRVLAGAITAPEKSAISPSENSCSSP